MGFNQLQIVFVFFFFSKFQGVQKKNWWEVCTSVGKNQDCMDGGGGDITFFCLGQQKTQTVLLMGITSLHYFFAVDCTDIQGC